MHSSRNNAALFRGTLVSPGQLAALWTLFFLLVTTLYHYKCDLSLADSIYKAGGQQWLWKHSFLTSDLIHHWGKNFSICLGAAVIIGLVVCTITNNIAWQRVFTYLLVCVAGSTLIVASLKQLTNIDCPWSLQQFGGDYPYLDLWQPRPYNLPAASCFPAGHASAGYAWVCLFFALHDRHPNWRYHGLLFGLSLGLIFGIGQQLRGAHFLSHDLWTLMICWTTSVLLAWVWFPTLTEAAASQQDIALSAPN